VFVYGRTDTGARFPARQSEAACRSLARLHGLAPGRTVFARQHPGAIAAGAFHDDVVAVASGAALLYHEGAFAETDRVLGEISSALAPADLEAHRVSAAELPLDTAVACYLFNSQLLPLADGSTALVAPEACRRTPAALAVIDRWREAVPLGRVEFVPLAESMANGGGPACLRLRLELTAPERAAVHPGVLLDEPLLERLAAWVERHYRDRLALADLADPHLLDEGRAALDELTRLLDLGAFYPFQR
jgi:succinylarginine dihydrolase